MNFKFLNVKIQLKINFQIVKHAEFMLDVMKDVNL